MMAGKEFVKTFDLPLSDSLIKKRVITGDYDLVDGPLAKYFVNDVSSVLNDTVNKSYKSIEFARIFGAKGERLNYLLKDLDELNLLAIEENNLDIQNQIQKLILLDGHHRFEHLSLYNYDYPIPVVLVSNQDVKIQSYNSKINVTKEQFIEFLIVNDFEPSSSKYFLSIQDNNYSNKKINSIYELYDFKRKLIDSNLINPIRNDVSGSEDIIVNFTPIKLIEFYRENYLFPPKSTWISPRI